MHDIYVIGTCLSLSFSLKMLALLLENRENTIAVIEFTQSDYLICELNLIFKVKKKIS